MKAGKTIYRKQRTDYKQSYGIRLTVQEEIVGNLLK